MGDRGNIIIRDQGDNPSAGVHLYTHWDGMELPRILQRALIRGRYCWDDLPYLTRIIFSELAGVHGHWDLTGYGISTYMIDSDSNQNIVIDELDEQKHVLANGSRWTFDEYVSLDLSPEASGNPWELL